MGEFQATEAELLEHLSRDFDKEGHLYKTGPSPKVPVPNNLYYSCFFPLFNPTIKK